VRALLVTVLVASFLVPAAPAVAMKKVKPTAKQQLAKACKSKAKRRKLSKAKRRRCAKLLRRKAATKPTSPAVSAPGGLAQPGAGGTPTPTPAPDDDPYSHDVPDLPPSNPRALQVIAGEFFLNLSKPEVLAGDVRVEFNNAYAEDPHDLHLVRKNGDGDSYSFGELQSGEVEAKTLNLKAGSWQLFCALPEHADRGMLANLRVVSE
jgi:hypothetical protein